MSNISPIHKKKSKNVKENHRSVSLIPILGKMFEKVSFDSLTLLITSFLYQGNLVLSKGIRVLINFLLLQIETLQHHMIY